MLAKRVIPCLDVDRGRVVKGTNFLNLRDAGDPVSVAARYEQEGEFENVDPGKEPSRPLGTQSFAICCTTNDSTAVQHRVPSRRRSTGIKADSMPG